MESQNSGIQFNAYMDLDGKGDFDYYEQNKYEHDIMDEIGSFDPHSSCFVITDTDLYCDGTYDGEKASSDYMDYIRKGKVTVDIEADIYGSDVHETASVIHDYMGNLYDCGYKIGIFLNNGDKHEILTARIKEKDKTLPSVDVIEDRVRNVLCD